MITFEKNTDLDLLPIIESNLRNVHKLMPPIICTNMATVSFQFQLFLMISNQVLP